MKKNSLLLLVVSLLVVTPSLFAGLDPVVIAKNQKEKDEKERLECEKRKKALKEQERSLSCRPPRKRAPNRAGANTYAISCTAVTNSLSS